MIVCIIIAYEKWLSSPIVCYPPRVDIVKQYEYLDRYIECNEWRWAECWSAQINSWQVWYKELIWLQDLERAKYEKYRWQY